MALFALRSHLCQHYSIPYKAMIDEPRNSGIIKLILLIKILTTWVLWSEGQRDGKDANAIQRYYAVIAFIDLDNTSSSYRGCESVNSYSNWI